MMRKLFFAAVFAIAGFSGANAQIMQRLQNARPEDRKVIIKNMTPEERKNMIRQFRDEMLVDDLEIPEDKREAFQKVYAEYQQSQKNIKSGFNTNFDPDQLTEAEAQQKLEESFDLGRQLIDNREKYAQKMRDIIKPQQVIKMFQNEGMMKEKMMDRRMDIRLREDSAAGRSGNNEGFRKGSAR